MATKKAAAKKATAQTKAPAGTGKPGSVPNPNKPKTSDPREPSHIPADPTKPIPQNVVMATQEGIADAPHHGRAHRPNAVAEGFETEGHPGLEEDDEQPVAPRTMRVRATRTGFYDNARRRADDVFTIAPQDFSDKWMQAIDKRTPERKTGPNAHLKRQHDEILGMKVEGKTPKRDTDDDVI